jgi:hypothetical protein
MSDTRAGCSRDFDKFFSDLNQKNSYEFDSDDSVKDRDYIESGIEDSSSCSEEQQVRVKCYVAYTFLPKILAT